MSLAILTFFEDEFQAATSEVFGAAKKVETATVAAIKDIPGFLASAAAQFQSLGLSLGDLTNIFNAVRGVAADLGGKGDPITKLQAVVGTLSTAQLPAGAQSVIHQVVTTATAVIDAKAVLAAALGTGTAVIAPAPAAATPSPAPAPVAAEPETSPPAAA